MSLHFLYIFLLSLRNPLSSLILLFSINSIKIYESIPIMRSTILDRTGNYSKHVSTNSDTFGESNREKELENSRCTFSMYSILNGHNYIMFAVTHTMDIDKIVHESEYDCEQLRIIMQQRSTNTKCWIFWIQCFVLTILHDMEPQTA